MEPKKHLSLVSFPIDAQSNPFFSALATALLPLLGYTEQTPFFCSPKGEECVHCGGCGGKTALQKHQLLLYHDLQTLTGVSFGWTWPEADGAPYQTLSGGGEGWRWPDGFWDEVMGLVGLGWRRLSKKMGRDALWREITGSLAAGSPVLLRLGTQREWQVADGYQDGMLCGLVYSRTPAEQYPWALGQHVSGGRFSLADWYPLFEDAVVFTGPKASAITFAAVLERIVGVLSHPTHRQLEGEVFRRIDAVTAENARETSCWLNQLAAFPIEARWHAAEAACNPRSLFSRLAGEERQRQIGQLLFSRYIADNSSETHGLCWKIWELLGTGPASGYAPGEDAQRQILRPGVQAALKALFGQVFENDREVLRRLRELSGWPDKGLPRKGLEADKND